MDRNEYPWLYRAAERASGKAQSWHFFSFGLQLCILFVVGFLSAIPTWLPLTASHIRGTAVASAIALIVSIFIAAAVRERKYDKQWFDARAVAESAKTLSWRYMMGLPPFQVESERPDMTLIDELQKVSSSRKSTLAEISGIEDDKTQVSERMRQVRASPFDERKAYYLWSRVAEERDWYYEKAAINRNRSAGWYWGVVATQGVAIVLAILRAGDFILVSPVGLLMTLAASFSAWTRARRHDELQTSYSVAADELNNLAAKVELCTSEVDLRACVEDVEEAISREHTMWLARRNIAP